jgi:hypothetical protein
MADSPDSKGSNDKPNSPNPQAGRLDVRAESASEVRVDASERLSYKDYAKLRPEPVITVQRIIARKGPPEVKKRLQWPNMEVKQIVLWGELPKEDPPKPERRAATVKTHIMTVPPARKPPPPGIGSMEPGKG